jgi:hypothetical protein
MIAAVSNCKSCGASIYWATTELNKAAPIDAEPDPAGQWVMVMRAGKVRVLKYDPIKHGASAVRRTSHFATCPNANQHRSKGT